jgi:hypothetical protein
VKSATSQNFYFKNCVLSLGSYQLKQSLPYIAQRLDDNGLFFLEAFKDNNVKELNGNILIRAKLLSRHLKNLKLFILCKTGIYFAVFYIIIKRKLKKST